MSRHTERAPHTDPHLLPPLSDRLVTGLRLILEKSRSRPWRRVGETNKGPLQEGILRYLSQQPDKRAMMARLAQAMGVSPPTAIEAVRRLIKKGLVQRQADPHDRRVKYATITAAGLKAVKHPTTWMKNLRTACLSLPVAEQRRFLQYLTTLEVYTAAQPTSRPPLWRQVVQYLDDPDHHLASFATIQEALKVTAPALRQALTVLEKRGWMKREVDPTIARNTRLGLTPEGQADAQLVTHKLRLEQPLGTTHPTDT